MLGGEFDLTDRRSNEPAAQEAYMNSDRRYAPGSFWISPTRQRKRPLMGGKRVRLIREEFLRQRKPATASENSAVQRSVAERYQNLPMAVAQNQQIEEFNSKYGEWPATLTPDQYNLAVQNFGRENVPYEPVTSEAIRATGHKVINGRAGLTYEEYDKVTSYKLMGSGPEGPTSADDWMLDKQMEAEARPADADVELYTNEVNDELALKSTRPSLEDPGAEEWYFGRETAMRGSSRGYRDRLSAGIKFRRNAANAASKAAYNNAVARSQAATPVSEAAMIQAQAEATAKAVAEQLRAMPISQVKTESDVKKYRAILGMVLGEGVKVTDDLRS